MVPVTASASDIIVVGGGIAGLVIAWEAARAGRRVIVCESGDDTGGMLRRGRVAGVDVDLGAESFAIRTSGVADLVADAALPLQIVEPRPEGAHLVLPGAFGRVRRMPLPRRAVVGMPAEPEAGDVVRAIGRAGARRAAQERDLPAGIGRESGVEPSLFDLATARYGRRVAERLVDPLCQSVYSQPSSAVRLSAVHPSLWAEFERRGSLTAAAGAVAPAARAGSAVRGIDGGMWRLAAALRDAAEAAGAIIRTGAAVQALRPAAYGVEVVLAGETLRAGHVVVATGPAAAGALLRVDAAAPVGGAVRLVTAEVVSRALDARPVGSGVIVPPAAGGPAKALTHVDAKWEWAARALPVHTHVVRLSARDADAPGLDTPAAVAGELRRLTGARIRPADVWALTETRWTDAVTSASAAAAAWRTAARAATPAGIHLAGATVAGTGLASVIPHARELARELVARTSHPATA
ncbi:FAD-dependent oxidoreductase [Microbacterium saccharophilum]|uniref:FAD-dependent oxidoreductase n=2 Tax=Microbacterium saccharophilum TaxID=1213358 RepID=A0A5C8I8X3_9MICO|nr:FAD-dependent oxidoreductase [Microbacterium saccharophilum]GEP46872.1 protoporphyrinogen oxidase [Microbacterium saccharophilum]